MAAHIESLKNRAVSWDAHFTGGIFLSTNAHCCSCWQTKSWVFFPADLISNSTWISNQFTTCCLSKKEKSAGALCACVRVCVLDGDSADQILDSVWTWAIDQTQNTLRTQSSILSLLCWPDRPRWGKRLIEGLACIRLLIDKWEECLSLFLYLSLLYYYSTWLQTTLFLYISAAFSNLCPCSVCQCTPHPTDKHRSPSCPISFFIILQGHYHCLPWKGRVRWINQCQSSQAGTVYQTELQ